MKIKIAGLMLIFVSILTMAVLPGVTAQENPPPATEGRPLLGVTFRVNEEGFPQIARVEDGTPAAEAGLLSDDVITAIDGESMLDQDLAEVIGAYAPGDTIAITVLRDGEEIEFEATLAEFAQSPERPGVRVQVLATTFLGISVEANEDGIVILDVVEGSPAEEAGMQEGDLVIGINDQDVSDVEGLRETIRAMSPGDTITVTVMRDGEEIDLEATLSESAPPQAIPAVPMPMMVTAFLGIGVEAGEDGITITSVVEGSPAEEAGLQEGDLVVGINGQDLSDVGNLREVIQAMSPGDTITVTVMRDGEEVEIEATLSTTPGMNDRGILRGDFGRSFGNDNEIEFLADEGVWVIHALDEDSTLLEDGLQVGDRITGVNGEAFDFESDDSRGMMRAFALGGEATLTVERDGETLEIEVSPLGMVELMLGAMPLDIMMDTDMMMPLESFRGIIQIPPMGQDQVAPDGTQPPGRQRNGQVWLGIRYLLLNEQSAEARDLPVSEGALLIEVETLSPADVAGLQVGDVIQGIDGHAVDGRRALSRQLRRYRPGDTVTLDVWRAGETLQIEITLERVPQSD